MKTLALILDLVGTVMIAYAALRVHHRVLNEHKIDKHVFTVMRREQVSGIIGVLCVLTAFIIELLLEFRIL